jgi:D-aminoacyl-tRNA deacylase
VATVRGAITLSTVDPAAANMFKAFKARGFEEGEGGVYARGGVYLIPVPRFIVPEEEYKTPAEPNPYPLDYDAIAKELGVDYFVVASRHSARSGLPCLTAHATGNYGKAIFGGRSRELQHVPPDPLRNVYLAMLRSPPAGFQVSLEATHHSPTQFETPMFFAEVGSSEAQWADTGACEYLVDAILEGIASTEHAPAAIGFGGGHYCPKFSVMEREHAFGHIAAKYALPELTEEMIGQMIAKTAGGVEKAYIESGVKGSDKRRVESMLGHLGVETEIV